MLKHLHISRGNIAQSGHFSTFVPKHVNMLCIHDTKKVSHKFKCNKRKEIFGPTSCRFPKLYKKNNSTEQ